MATCPDALCIGWVRTVGRSQLLASLQRGKTAIEIGLVVDILQTDVERRPAVTSRVSDCAAWTVRRSKSSCACITQDVMPHLQPDRENNGGWWVEAERVNNKTQKWAVNPLTRHASRSVMRLDYHRRKLRGLLRY